jgi:nucleoside-diphosphate-sugar epimerase
VVDAAAPYPLYLFDHAQGTRRQREAAAAARTDLLLNAVRDADASLVYVGTQVSTSAPPTGLMDLGLRIARAAHPYFSVKRLIDEKIAAAQVTGLAAVTVRPSACIGPWDSKPAAMCWVPALLNGQLRMAVEHAVNVVDTRDVAIAVADTLEARRFGPALCVSGTDTTVRGLFDAFCASAGVPAPGLAVPAQLSVLPGLWSETLLATLGVRTPLPGLIPLLICEQGRARERNDGPPPRPLGTTVRDTIEWYRRLGYC